MEKISSGGTLFTKVFFPVLWLGILALIVVQVISTDAWKQPPFIIVLLLMAAFGYFLYRKLIWDLADEVRDGGSFLLVYKGSMEVRVPLANVMNVSMNQFSNPKRLTLRLRMPCELGDEIVFIPKKISPFNLFARNPIAENLMRRVDNARRGETA